jgi:hypothetical protein
MSYTPSQGTILSLSVTPENVQITKVLLANYMCRKRIKFFQRRADGYITLSICQLATTWLEEYSSAVDVEVFGWVFQPTTSYLMLPPCWSGGGVLRVSPIRCLCPLRLMSL